MLGDVTRELASQQFMNVTNRMMPAENSHFFYFTIPVQFGAQQQQVQIRLDKEQRDKNWWDAEQMSLVVSLDTMNLGMVLFHVNWHKRGELALQGVVQSEAVKKYVDTKRPELIKSLSDLGFHVADLGVKVAPREAEQDLRMEAISLAAPVKPWVVDIKI